MKISITEKGIAYVMALKAFQEGARICRYKTSFCLRLGSRRLLIWWGPKPSVQFL